jgi:hypothetical protein
MPWGTTVATSLARSFIDSPRPGWIRGDATKSDDGDEQAWTIGSVHTAPREAQPPKASTLEIAASIAMGSERPHRRIAWREEWVEQWCEVQRRRLLEPLEEHVRQQEEEEAKAGRNRLGFLERPVSPILPAFDKEDRSPDVSRGDSTVVRPGSGRVPVSTGLFVSVHFRSTVVVVA